MIISSFHTANHGNPQLFWCVHIILISGYHHN